MALEPVSVWTPIRNADYRKLWLGQTVSVVGDKLQQIAMAMLVYQRTGSMLQMGVMLGVTALPAVLFGLPAGVVGDWADRRLTMIVADLLRAALVLAVPFVAGIDIRAAYVMAFLVSTASLFFDPARLALMPELLPEDQLLAANSLDQMSLSGAELLGLAAGAAVVALVGVTGAFAIDAATFVVSAVAVALVAHRAAPLPPVEAAGTVWRRMREDLAEGLGAIWHDRVMRDATQLYALSALAGMGMVTLVNLMALFTLKGGAVTLAVMDGAITVGMFVGAYLINRVGGRPGPAFLAGIAGLGLCGMGLAFMRSMLPTLPLLLLSGVANIWFVIASITMVQQAAPSAIRGRVFSARSSITRLAGVIGLVGAGALAEAFGVRTVFGATGAALVVVAVVGLSSRAVREA
jgi:MFS family permease